MSPDGGTPAPDSKRSFFGRFFDNFGKVPEEKPPLIPQPYRIPFFLTLALVSLAVLVLLVWLVIVPGIRSQQSSMTAATALASRLLEPYPGLSLVTKET